MAMNGYKPTPGIHSPQTWSDYDRDSLSKEPLNPTAGKSYDTIKSSGDGKCIVILCCI